MATLMVERKGFFGGVYGVPKIVRNRLTATAVRNAKPGKHCDGLGLYLIVSQQHGKSWVWRGTVRGQRREYGLGPASLVTLAEARQLALEYSRIAHKGGDPAELRSRKAPLSLREAVEVYHRETVAPRLAERGAREWLASLEGHVLPALGDRPVADISGADVLAVLGPLWHSAPVAARRLRQRVREVLDWCIAAGHRDSVNPVQVADGGLSRARPPVQHRTAIAWRQAPEVYARLRAMQEIGAAPVALALLTAARSLEVRGAEWSEIDGDGRLWAIPAERTKTRRPHRVPLSGAALTLLQGLPRRGGLVFPGRRGLISGSALLEALRAASGHAAADVHGLRSAFRDWAGEAAHAPREVAEACLAHIPPAVERAYARSDLLERRRELMEAWGQFCSGD